MWFRCVTVVRGSVCGRHPNDPVHQGEREEWANHDYEPVSLSEPHQMVSETGKCKCGWVPKLGDSLYRSFDKHLLEMRGKERE